MKHLKIVVLAAVAATALMATVGAGTASATLTALCKQPTTIGGLPTCEAPHLYPAGTRVHAELEAGTKFILATPVAVVECGKSTLDVTTEQATAIPLGATVNAFTFGECEGGGGEVEITTVKNGTLDIELIDLPEWTHNGTLTFTGTEIKVFFKALGIECRYAPGHAGTLTGGQMATIDFDNTVWPRIGGSFLCGGNGNAAAAYTVTSPEPLWVSM
ncbi:MAG TPA: hypothetical protein VFT79_01510 [Solirubrobacterales bacterium]|nr:hypothetical protein [Solirubrobacterales bacterium]